MNLSHFFKIYNLELWIPDYFYNVSDHLTKVIHSDKDWIHFGTDNEINYDLK